MIVLINASRPPWWPAFRRKSSQNPATLQAGRVRLRRTQLAWRVAAFWLDVPLKAGRHGGLDANGAITYNHWNDYNEFCSNRPIFS